MFSSYKVKFTINLCLWLTVTYVLSKFNLPSNSLLSNSIQNSGHTLVFFSLTIVAGYTLMQTRAMYSGVVIVLAIFAVGFAVEVIQYFYGRGASGSDVLMNASGIMMAILVIRLVSFPTDNKYSLLLGINIAVLLLITLHRPIVLLIAGLSQNALPVINNFESIFSGVKWTASNARYSIENRAPAWSENNSRSLKVTFESEKWPSVRLQEIDRNWCGYQFFKFDVFNPNQYPIGLQVRIDEISPDQKDVIKTIFSLHILPGVGNEVVKLDNFSLEYGNTGRNNRIVSSFVLYLSGKSEGETTLYFDNFRLERSNDEKFRRCIVLGD